VTCIKCGHDLKYHGAAHVSYAEDQPHEDYDCFTCAIDGCRCETLELQGEPEQGGLFP
jgi:hypothetical protein